VDGGRAGVGEELSLAALGRHRAPRLTVIVGSNGSGKSNLYKALGLIAEAAHGRLALAMLAEGGMPSALFAGERNAGPVRMTLGAQLDDYRYELELGLPADPGLPVESASPFMLDPIVKSERILTGVKPTRRTLLCDRAHVTAQLARLIRDMSTRTQVWVSTHSPELAGLLASVENAMLVRLAFDNGTTRARLDAEADDDDA
jgi:predicted ATPase